MQNNLVIVESPSKAKTLKQFLGKEYNVMSSKGHIRDLKKKSYGLNLDDFTPQYEIPADKVELVKQLKAAAKKADTVWLASDEDREGEAISWHLAQVLGLSVEETKRIVFHEITKPAILAAIASPRHIDINLVNAQQARRVLDRIVGFKLSPVLWRRLKPHLSAGRVQSVAVRLIVEREREIEGFVSESSFRVTGDFRTDTGATLQAEFSRRFATQAEAEAFLRQCEGRRFVVSEVSKKPLHRTPAAPFTTSTMQQEAARKLGFTVSQTMSVAQRLYEAGLITYMRTDSVNLSSLCLGASRTAIVQHLGERYAKTRQYHTSTKGAQEAHEAIRPTYMDRSEIEGTAPERRLYDLVWKRTIASQMADAELEKTTVSIVPAEARADDAEGVFQAVAEVVTFDGFLRVYRESFDDDATTAAPASDAGVLHDSIASGQLLDYTEIQATERFSQGPTRYNEASLVHKLEELGIGRPSTYAPTISTIQQREYVQKGDKKGERRNYQVLTLAAGKSVKAGTKSEVVGKEKNKLLPTDIGTVVNDFLVENFPNIVDYNFTARVEKDFDEIAEGREDWQQMMADFYHQLEPEIDHAMQDNTGHKMGERLLGIDPATGKEVLVKIGRFGPLAQLGRATDDDKPRFAQLGKEQSIQSITLEEALELFKLPRTLGEHEGQTVSVGAGRFGPYVQLGKVFASIPEGTDPMDVTLDEAIRLIDEKRTKATRNIKTFDEEPELELLNGRFGPYLIYKDLHCSLPRSIKDPSALTVAECMEILKKHGKKAKTTSRSKAGK